MDDEPEPEPEPEPEHVDFQNEEDFRFSGEYDDANIISIRTFRATINQRNRNTGSSINSQIQTQSYIHIHINH
jgi:hypothetical protein